MYQLGASNRFVMLLYRTFMTVLQQSVGSFGKLSAHHCISGCWLFQWMMLATESLTALRYCLHHLDQFHSFQLGNKHIGLPCVHHGLLQLCKTWVSTSRCSWMVDLTVIQQNMYICCIKVSNLEQTEGCLCHRQPVNAVKATAGFVYHFMITCMA